LGACDGCVSSYGIGFGKEQVYPKKYKQRSIITISFDNNIIGPTVWYHIDSHLIIIIDF
jgi:hypothetical protein